MADTNAPRRIPELDGLRSIAIGMVFFHHLIGGQMLWMGVDIFFVLSGFLITGILLSQKERGATRGQYFAHFYGRRARRILPAYVVALVVISPLFTWSWLHQWWWYAFFMANIAAALHVAPDVLISLWSLGVEEQFYLGWPWVIWMAEERRVLQVAVAMIFIGPVLRWLCTPLFPTYDIMYFLTPFRVDLLGAGAVLSILWRRNHQVFRRWAAGAWIAIFTTVILLAATGRYLHWHRWTNSRASNTVIYSLAVVISASLVVLCLHGKNLFAWTMRLAPLRFLGIISYTMYLVHAAFLRWFVLRIPQTWLAGLLGAATTIAFATIAWYGWERRILFAGRPSKKHPAALTGA